MTFGYFVPAVRHFTALVAGMSELEYRIFAVFAYSGAVIWVSTFVGLGYIVGDNWEPVMRLVHRYTWAAAGLGIAGLFVGWWVRRRLRSTVSPRR